MNKFVHLHVHSHYSLLDGLSKIPDMVRYAKELGMDALALTDHGTMYGAIEFYKECKKAGIKPIIGMEAYVAPDSHLTKSSGGEKYYHLTLLAKNQTGYKNLIQLSTVGHLKGFYYKPRIDKQLLEEYHEGLIALSGCLHGEIARLIVSHKYDEAKKTALYYEGLFGKGNFYLEVQDHARLAEQGIVNEAIKRLHEETGIPVAATADSHYLHIDDREAQDIMLCVQMGKTVNDPNRLDMRDTNVSLRSSEEMAHAFADMPEAITNTTRIADLCDVQLEFGKWAFPLYPVPEGKTAADYLEEIALQGLEKRYELPVQKIPGDVIERLHYELDIIARRGFSTYFLVVADYVNWARSKGIICATRGSAAGSLVSYCIGITMENPLNFRLPFERFLNLYRPTPPDIDMDFADDRRNDVLQYVKEKYGENKVAQICTFGAMMARAAVRDVARALGFPYTLGDRIAKMVPTGLHGFHMTIEEAMKQNPDLQALYDRESDVRRVIDLARKVEGCVRHASVHAAGVVISPTDITDFTPLQLEPGGTNIITQYDMHACEDVGLVKMDFLGVRNLSILGLARDLVKKTKNIAVDVQNLKFDDAKTYELFARGETMGVFQLSGAGMTRYLKELKPSNIFDIMAMVALYRPGPMNSIPEFIRRKHNPKLMSYLDPRLENILDRSYGVLTFQDDVLLIAIELAGYTWEEADKLRKAMGKKIPEEMAKQRDKFINGCVVGNLQKTKAESLWLLIEPFAAYGFNKAHAASYAAIAYQTGYMKAHFSAEYMTAILTSESGDTEKQAEAIVECKRLGIEVLAPSVNASDEAFTYVDDTHIRFGLLSIKNVGTDIAQAIIRERVERGIYETVEDFLTRVPSKNLNKKSLEAFIMSGALDEFYDRRIMLDNVEKLLNFRRDIVEGKNNLQTSLFAAIAAGFSRPKLALEGSAKATRREKLQWEKELLGLYLSDHPFSEYELGIDPKVTRLNELADKKEGEMVRVSGIVTSSKAIMTKAGERMYFVRIDDSRGTVELVVFPRVAKEYMSLWNVDAALSVSGKVSSKDGELKILVDMATLLLPRDEKPANREGERIETNKVLSINLSGVIDQEKLGDIKKILATYPGEHQVFFVINQAGSVKKIITPFRVAVSDQLMQSLEERVGEGRVKV